MEYYIPIRKFKVQIPFPCDFGQEGRKFQFIQSHAYTVNDTTGLVANYVQFGYFFSACQMLKRGFAYKVLIVFGLDESRPPFLQYKKQAPVLQNMTMAV